MEAGQNSRLLKLIKTANFARLNRRCYICSGQEPRMSQKLYSGRKVSWHNIR